MFCPADDLWANAQATNTLSSCSAVEESCLPHPPATPPSILRDGTAPGSPQEKPCSSAAGTTVRALVQLVFSRPWSGR